jgi:hypothetical protein
VRPTGTLDYPNLDQAFFKLVGTSQSRKADAKIHVSQEGAKLEIEASTASEVQLSLYKLNVERKS